MTPLQQQIYPIIHALLFTSDQPLSVTRLSDLLATQIADIALQDIEQAIHQISQTLANSGLVLARNDEGYRIQVAKDYLDWVYQLYQQSPPKLSRALLETLAIMAHRQPVTRAEVEAVRGVAVSSQIMAQLKNHGWVKSAGVKEVPGHPVLWVTTPKLLQDLGISNKETLIARLEQIMQDFLAEQDNQRQTPLPLSEQ